MYLYFEITLKRTGKWIFLHLRIYTRVDVNYICFNHFLKVVQEKACRAEIILIEAGNTNASC